MDYVALIAVMSSVFAVYIMIGIVVMVRLEMWLTGMTLKEMCKRGSASKAILFRTNSRVVSVLFFWPIFGVMCAMEQIREIRKKIH